MSVIDYLLVRDGWAGRALRRRLAEQGGAIGVRVGTYADLIQQVRDSYLVTCDEDWSEQLSQALETGKDAFWAKSHEVDPNGVSTAVEQAWREILLARPPGSDWPVSDNPRINKRLSDLARLNRIDVKSWPEDLSVMWQVLNSESKPHRGLRVIQVDTQEQLNVWQKALVERLNAEAGQPEKNDLEDVAKSYETDLHQARAPQGTDLHVTQHCLFTGEGKWQEKDGSCEFIRVRDSLESIELVAGLIQQRMRDEPALGFSDFGLLLPQNFSATDLLRNSFTDWGIPTANLRQSQEVRDLGAELIRFVLLRFEGPIPGMAMKAIVTNPLMPWPADVGLDLAETLERYEFKLKPEENAPASYKTVTDLLEGAIGLSEVPAALQKLLECLSKDEALARHRERANEVADEVIKAIANGKHDWDSLKSLCNPKRCLVSTDSVITQQGVTVYYEGETPWRPVKELFVLDFVSGSFPQPQNLSLVFSPDDWRQLASAGLQIQLPRERVKQEREKLRLQIGHASERVRFIVPGFTAAGERLSPSSSLTELALLKGKADSPDALLKEFESDDQRSQIHGLPLAAEAAVIEPRDVQAQDMQLDANLLERSETGNERPKQQSPSNLDFLLVSPLAWLLRQLKAEPLAWETDEFTPMMNGTLAHDVFEQVFAAQTHNPVWEEIQPKIEPAFEQALSKQSPFLSAPGWAVERQNLLGTITRAAEVWCGMLKELDATVLRPEIWLQGNIDGVAIHGQADALLSLGDGKVAVVDYKNSSSDKFSQRMNAHLDLQASLYRQMINTDGPKPNKHFPEDERQKIHRILQEASSTSVVYFTMGDRAAISDFQPNPEPPGWEAIEENVSEQALLLLKERFSEIRNGQLKAPENKQVKALTKKGVAKYALEMSPLTKPVIGQDNEGDYDDA